MSLGAVDYLILVVYTLAMLGIGWAVTSKIRGFHDYFSAGGALTTPLLICTLVSTYYGLEATFSTSEVGFHHGLVAWFWFARPYYVAIFIAAFVVARKLRGRQFWSLPDVLEAHYGKWTRVAGATACMVYSLPIVSITGLGILFETMGWPKGIGLSVGVTVCLIYTLCGGLWADAITDTVQFVIMCLALAIAIPRAIDLAGGYDFVDYLPARYMTTTGGVSPWLIGAWICASLTVFVEPTFYQRIFAAKDEKSVVRALLAGLLFWAAYDWAVTLLGMVAKAAIARGNLPETLEGNRALLEVCMASLPVGLRGLFIGGILATAMSSVDSYSLLASANLVYDIYRPLRGGRVSDRALLLGTRVGVVVVTLLGLLVSLLFERIADAWVFMASALTSVVFVPVMGAVLFRPRPAAGLASSVAGLVGLVAFHAVVHSQGVYDDGQGSYKLVLGAAEIWREYAVLFALPISCLAFIAGHVGDRRR